MMMMMMMMMMVADDYNGVDVTCTGESLLAKNAPVRDVKVGNVVHPGGSDATKKSTCCQT